METLLNIEDIKQTNILDNTIKNNVSIHVLYAIERQVLIPKIGQELYNQLLLQKRDHYQQPQYKTLVFDYILFAVAYRLKAELMMDLTFQLKSSGVAQNTSERITNLSISDIQTLQQMSKKESEWFIEEMINYVKANKDIFP